MSKDAKRNEDAKAEHYAACKKSLEEMEATIQAKWAKEKPYENQAPKTFDPENKNKFYVTFPYPYMNGMLHIGHAFSVTKSEFAVRYNRLRGRNVLWPFGLHVTGTPIAACAQKLTNEMKMYGNPPQFPEEVLNPEAKPKEAELAPGQFKAKRMKVAKGKPQWHIMQGMDLPDSEIPKFANARHWLDTFPALCLEDLQALGLHIDYRRSFITTSENPFYDRFIQWQFRKLKEANYLKWGKRYCIYSPLDGQPCADHDRATGEGVQPQEYTVVKLIVQNALEQPAFAEFKDIIGDKDVTLPGATLRCETVVGQTNAWVSPTIRYAAFEVESAAGKQQIQVMTTKCARNMAYQGIKVNGKLDYDPVPLFEVDGEKMVGLPLTAPHCPYKTIYALPMATITEAKGTGVVMSVPSDSPDDYINFIQLVKKPEYRAKLGLKDEWVTAFDPCPKIINIPDSDLGDESAPKLIEKLKIQGPKDAEKLEEAKKEAYQAGFYKGVMTAGPFTGKKVAEAKVLMADLLVKNDEAYSYREPMKEVMSRSGDTCVVALCDQWYLEYGKEDWKKAVRDHLDNNMECYFHGIRNGFEVTLDWLADWPCSRSFGLGTVLPFNKEDMLIDSLSDSTIYMAYYMLAHYLHHPMEDGSWNLDGTKPNKYGLKPEMFTDATFDYIFKGVGSAEGSGLPKEIAEEMRNEFNYWYPVDLRVSGKDLIQNHLTMFLYNHAAIWPEDNKLWPRSIYCNGHVQVDGEKMSKAKGNSISLRDGIKMYSTDSLRLTLADAGDSLDDGNFVRDTAKGFVLKLTNLIETFKAQMAKAGTDGVRTGEYNLFDKIFDNAINHTIKTADQFYAGMSFRSAMNQIFFESAKDESFYTMATAGCKPHIGVVTRYIETMALLLAPITPHASDYIWTEILKKEGSIMNATITEIPAVDLSLQQAGKIINDVITEIRQQTTKVAKKRGKIDVAYVYVATEYLPWQVAGLEALKKIYEANKNSFPQDTTKQIQSSKADWLKGNMQEVMAFIAFTRDNVVRCGPAVLAPTPLVDEKAVLTEALTFIQSHSGVATVHIHPSNDESIAGHAQARGRARPAQPSVALPVEEKKK